MCKINQHVTILIKRLRLRVLDHVLPILVAPIPKRNTEGPNNAFYVYTRSVLCLIFHGIKSTLAGIDIFHFLLLIKFSRRFQFYISVPPHYFTRVQPAGSQQILRYRLILSTNPPLKLENT
jgi:hypothetical protein